MILLFANEVKQKIIGYLKFFCIAFILCITTLVIFIQILYGGWTKFQISRIMIKIQSHTYQMKIQNNLKIYVAFDPFLAPKFIKTISHSVSQKHYNNSHLLVYPRYTVEIINKSDQCIALDKGYKTKTLRSGDVYAIFRNGTFCGDFGIFIGKDTILPTEMFLIGKVQQDNDYQDLISNLQSINIKKLEILSFS